jgi:uncharacterized protein (DUF2461 family)
VLCCYGAALFTLDRANRRFNFASSEAGSLEVKAARPVLPTTTCAGNEGARLVAAAAFGGWGGEESVDEILDDRLSNASAMHDGLVKDRPFQRGERGPLVQICGQRLAPHGLREDASERRAAGFGELRSKRLELGVRCCSLADSANDVGQVAAIECSRKRDQVLDKITADIAGGNGMRHFLHGERVEEKRRLIGPVPIQGTAGHATYFGEAEMRDGIDSLVDQEGPGCVESLRPGSFRTRIHRANSGTSCAREHLRHRMCHMQKGYGKETAAFFTALEADNSKEFWSARRSTYDEVIKPTFLALLDGIDGFGSWRVYRPNNDTRFGTAKGPYKTFIGAVAERPDGVGAFVQLSAKGLLVGTGNPMPAPDQLTKLRAAIAADDSGAAFTSAVEAVRRTKAIVHAGRYDPLQRVPRGFATDHVRAEFLKWKGIEINHRPRTPSWLDSPAAPERITDLIALGGPLHDWLGHNVGPSALTPEERFAPKKRA